MSKSFRLQKAHTPGVFIISNHAAIVARASGGIYYISMYKQLGLLNLTQDKILALHQQPYKHHKNKINECLMHVKELEIATLEKHLS